MIIGVLAGVVPFLAVTYLKKILGYDDALDTFGVHGVGGTMGAILTGVFAEEKANSGIVGLSRRPPHEPDQSLSPSPSSGASSPPSSSPSSSRSSSVFVLILKSKAPASTSPNTAKPATNINPIRVSNPC
jgi:hypothetical protein